MDEVIMTLGVTSTFLVRGSVGFALVLGALAACGSSSGADASMDGNCPLVVEIGGASSSPPFTVFQAGDLAAMILGFQGFQMLSLDVRVAGSSASTVDLTAFLVIPDTGVEASGTRRGGGEASGDALLVTDFLLFFNDAPLSQIGGHDADLEIIARSGGCVGGGRVRIHLRDEPPCIDPDAYVPDVTSRDAGVPDGAVLCSP